MNNMPIKILEKTNDIMFIRNLSCVHDLDISRFNLHLQNDMSGLTNRT